MSPPNGSTYLLVVSGQTRDRITSLGRRAKQKGKGAAVVAARKELSALLRTEPFRFGEPLYTLRQMNLQVRLGLVAPFAVLYAVHHARPLVFILDVRLGPAATF